MQVVILLGAPGAGKGTTAVRLVDRLGCLHLSTGAMLRDIVSQGTPAGREAERYMDSGELVPDTLISRLVAEELSKSDAPLFLLDGFPRTVNQAGLLQETLADEGGELVMVCNLDVPQDVLVLRLGGRLVCPKCSGGYHLVTLPPKVEGMCDRCGVALVQREDDDAATVARRLEVYEEQTAPLIAWYQERGLLVRVDANRLPEDINITFYGQCCV